MTDQAEDKSFRILQGLEDKLYADLEHFRALAKRDRELRARRRARELRERLQQRRRCIELRAGGRSGVKIAARVGIALRTLRRWQREDATFRVAYDSAYRLWKAGDDEGLRVLLAQYHPERQAREKVHAEV